MGTELQAISILVIFITVAFDMVVPDAFEALTVPVYPSSGDKIFTNQASLARRSLFRVVPLFVLTLVLAYLVTPRAGMSH